eukprot:1154380-Pelagomonas_calceolata.AAC.2
MTWAFIRGARRPTFQGRKEENEKLCRQQKKGKRCKHEQLCMQQNHTLHEMIGCRFCNAKQKQQNKQQGKQQRALSNFVVNLRLFLSSRLGCVLEHGQEKSGSTANFQA